MPVKSVMSFKGGVNLRLPAWHKDMETKKQCVLMQNLRYKDEFVDSIPGSKKFHGTTLSPSVSVSDSVSNGDFELWTSGDNVAPDGWTHIDFVGAVAKESVIKHGGSYSAKLTRSSIFGAAFYQNIDLTLCLGKTITFTCYVYATVANRARISIQSDDGSEYSSYHTGGGSWELLTVTKSISSSATYVKVNLGIDNGNTSAYFDDCSVSGTMRLIPTPVTAIMQYHNDQTDEFKLLAACGGSIYKKNPETNEFTELLGALTPDSIFGSDQRYDVLYIPSVKDGLKKYLGGEQIEKVGGGATAPGNFRQVLYMKEIDRMFGISDDAIYGQISWCDIGEPEVWDGANVERFKLKKGERVEGGAILYGKLIIFCTYSIWIYYVQGNEENWRLEEAPTTVGCPAPNTIKKVGSEIWFLGDAPEYDLGVYKFNGTISTLLTDDVSPLFKQANKEKLRNACAEIHDNLYTLSFAHEFSVVNDISIDLDLSNYKEDGVPAIYGPHTFGFVSACVLNNRQNSKQFLMGSETDGFIYAEGGTSFRGVNGDDGSLIPQRFISRIHNEDKLDMMRRYRGMDVFFRPRGFFKANIKTYLAYSGFGNTYDFRPSANFVGFAGEFDVFEIPLQGTPEIYTFHVFPEKDHCRGTSIQFEISNFNLNGQIAFDGYQYEYSELHTTRKVQSL